MLVAIGVFGGLGQILMTQSFRFADASIIACFDYTAMIWASMLGWSIFGEAPSKPVILGAAIVAISGLFVIWREHVLGLRRRAELEADPERSV